MDDISQRLDSLYNKKQTIEKNFKNIEPFETLLVENFKKRKGLKMPKVKIKVPKIKVPKIKVPKIKMPKIKMPKIKGVGGKKKKHKKSNDGEGNENNPENKTFMQILGFGGPFSMPLLNPGSWLSVFTILFFGIPNLILWISEKIVNIDILKNDQYDPKDHSKYNAFKESDKIWIYNSGIEFCQIFIAAYLASALYTNIYIQQQGDIETYLKTSYQFINVFLMDYVFIFLLFLPKGFHFLIYDVLFTNKITTVAVAVNKPPKEGMKLGSFPNLGSLGESLGKLGNSDNMASLGQLGNSDNMESLKKLGSSENVSKIASTMTNLLSGVTSMASKLKRGGGGVVAAEAEAETTTPNQTLRYLMFYIIAFGICSFYLKTIATMFLQMFRFEANPSMYIFILLGFITWVIGIATNMKMDIEISEESTWTVPNPIGIMKVYNMASLSYMILLLLHVVISLALAPIAQGTFSIYLFCFLSGGTKFFGNTIGNFFAYSESQISRELKAAHIKQEETLKIGKLPDTTWKKLLVWISTFDYFLYVYIFKSNEIMFMFILTSFFLYKILVTFTPPFNLNIFWLKTFFGIVNIMAFIGFGYAYYKLVKPSLKSKL